MKHQFAVDVVVDCRSLLGEGVTWDAESGTLLWLDVDQQLFHRLHAGGRHESTPLERRPPASWCPGAGAVSLPFPASRW